MSPEQAIFLGVLQGLTEFIPVSSSGHLVIAQSFIPGFSQPGVLFDAVLHGGTTLAVIWYFWERIVRLDRKALWLILVGTVPAGLTGVLFGGALEGLFTNVRAVGAALILTGAMNWAVDRKYNKQHTTKQMSWMEALVVGVFQALAIIPGISRSGATIFAGVAQGIKREDAAIFSFLLSIPAIFGAIGLQLFQHGAGNNIDPISYLFGMLAALFVGYISIYILMRLLISRRFRVFAAYCFVVGITTLFLVK